MAENEQREMTQAAGRPRIGWRAALLGVLVLLLLAGAVGMGARNAYRQSQSALDTANRNRAFVPTVQVAEVRSAGQTINVSLPGTTQAFTTANIYARASGYIDKRPVDIGDKVKEGDLLVQITAPELDHEIEQAKATLDLNRANLRQQKANRDLAQITWNRDRPLVAQGWTTRQQGSIDEQNLKALDAAVASVEQSISAQEARIRTLEQQKAYQTVTAPFDGVVTQRNTDVGSLVQADATSGTFLFTLMQTDIIRAFVYVPQSASVGVAPGVEAIVRIPELPRVTFPGTVTRLADALQPDTRTLLTEIDVPNPDGVLRPGSYCTVELNIPRKDRLFVIPSDAVVFDSDGLHVAVLEDGVARMRRINLVHDLGTKVEVDQGLKEGDVVIRTPPINLADGARVQAAPIKEATK
ncbi:MAG TPA: efflux RND transporter periplasmic adaptor subunit [Hyphomicrobium sp.]|nr:efflux RND transporter periplasmic adaptor subunit [Hyphomicrobium sp.]